MEEHASGLDDIYGALSDDSRRSMIAALSARRLRVKDLAAVFPFSLNATSKHLKVLERAGIIERQVQGREHYFALKPDVLSAAKNWIDHYEDFAEQHLDLFGGASTDGPDDPLPERTPSFPDTPGGWLRHYRYEARTPSEPHLSRDSLASLLGVPAATVRRWEDGGAAPTNPELLQVAGVCDFTRVQTEFLLQAFDTHTTESPPEKTPFRAWASRALAVDYPAVIFDSLYFVRAWNEQFLQMFPTARLMTRAWHGIPLYKRIFDDGNPLMDLRVLVRCLREVWWRTAPYCGLPPYRSLLAEIRQIPNLEIAWGRFGHGRDIEEVGMPYTVSDAGLGAYEVTTLPVSLPPTYYLRTYVPQDDQARSVTSTVATNKVYFVPAPHWNAP